MSSNISIALLLVLSTIVSQDRQARQSSPLYALHERFASDKVGTRCVPVLTSVRAKFSLLLSCLTV